MKAMAGCRRFGAALGLALCGITAKADDPQSVSWNWSANPTQGTTVTNALDWFASANWVGGEPVNSNVLKADFTTGAPAATRYITLTQDVHLADISATADSTFATNTARKVVLISDHQVLFDRPDSISVPKQGGIMFYADVSWFKTIYPRSLIFCGEIGTASGASSAMPLAMGTPLEIRGDLFASSADPVRTLAAGFASSTINAGDLTLVAPHGSSVDVVGTWDQEKDSTFVFRAGAAHVLCAGTTVTGAGIPEGTFVKRIFSDSSIELSQPASETIAGNALTFAAFSPKVTQTISAYANQANCAHSLRFMKWRDEDDFRVTLTALTTISPTISYTFTVKEGALPATTVIQKGSDIAGKFVFDTCHVEFGVPGKTDSLVFTNIDSQVAKATSFARLAVSNGLAASLANFSKMAGTLVKEGAGSLSLQLTGAATDYTGTTVVKEGALTLTGAAELSVGTLAVSNGATLHVPAEGIRCETFRAQPGAIVSGLGTLTVTTFSDDLLGVTCTDGAQVVYADELRHGEIIIDAPATNVPGNPAVWFDAANLDSFTYVDEGGVNRISQWNDVRSAGILFATNTCPTRKPQLLVASDETHNCVYFEKAGNTGNITNSYELGWNRKLTGICSVFKVIGCRQGGGQFLGQSSFWRNAEYGSYTKPVFCDSDTAIRNLLTDSRFMVNGEPKDWHEGYAYPGSVAALLPEARIPQVVELHLADGQTGYAQGFSAQENSALGRNGNQDLYELIVYTNRLTETERLAVPGYLMKKWLNSEANFETASNVEKLPTLSAGQTLGVAAGTKMAAESLSGDGTVVKTGGGTLYVPDCHSASTSLKVAGGQVTVRSVSPTRETLPSGALLHLDTADETTYLGTRKSGETTYLTEWGDARGTGHDSVYCKNASSNPWIVPDKLNGLPMVDFGGFTYANNHVMTCRVMTVRSIFTVQNSEGTGGWLFGNLQHNCYTAGEMGFYGLIRYPVGSLTYPIIWGDVYNNTIKCFGPGATKTRLNGVDVVGTSSYWSNANDLLTVQLYEGVSGDSISHGNCNNPIYGGGKMIGELLYYENRLSNEETKRIEAYLNKKWFNRETPGYRPAQLAAVDVAEGATLTLVGGAPIQVTSCSGAGTVEGGIRFTADADWTVTVGADGVSSALTVTGTFDVSSVGSLVLIGTGKAAVGSYVLATTGGIIGDVGSIAIDSSAANGKRSYSLRQDGNDIVLDVQPFGLMMLVR